MFAGAEFTRENVTTPDTFAKKLAGQFIFGAQIGWTDLNDMIIFKDDISFDPEVHYIQKLTQAKKVANSYFIHGRVMRDLPH